MDPEACLQAAEKAIFDSDADEAHDHLTNYRQWRAAGGFQPEEGDSRAVTIATAIRRMEK